MALDKNLQNGNNSLLSRWKDKNASQTAALKISKAPKAAMIPLSRSQQRLWFLQQMYPESPVYNYSELYTFTGTFNTQWLLAALHKVVETHDVLRATYHMGEDVLYMKIATEPQIKVSSHDLSHLAGQEAEAKTQALLTLDARHAFVLSEHPMVLVSIIKLSNDKHLVLLSLHHISTDKWSMGVLRNDLAKYYSALAQGENLGAPDGARIQFTDYAYWQRNQPIDNGQLLYWKNKLAGEIPLINLPTDFSRPAVASFEGGAGPKRYFSDQRSAEILGLAKKLEVTPYVLFLSVYYVLLYRYSGQNDILIGTPIANRDHQVLEDIIGFFNDTLVLRTHLSDNLTFKTLVQQVRTTTLEAFSNKDVPFDLLVTEMKLERSRGINPFFQVMFLYHAVPDTPSFGPGLELGHDFFDAGVSKFDLTLYISEEKGRLATIFEYTSDLFTPETIVKLQDQVHFLIDRFIEDVDQPIATVSMVAAPALITTLANVQGVDEIFNGFKGIHEIIADISQKFPQHTAVTFGGQCITYFELEQRANGLAASILAYTAGKSQMIGLLTERSIDMIVGLYAILKAGCAYVPLDTKYPEQRLKFMLEDAGVGLVVGQDARFFDTLGLQINFLTIGDSVQCNQIPAVIPQVTRKDLAYMIYTSGSTGQPKGVPISHGNIINSTAGRLTFYPHSPKAFLLMSSVSFDSSKAGIFWSLCTGGNLVISENRLEQDIEALQQTVFKNQVTHMLMLPSLYGLVLQYGNVQKLQSLNTVVVAGEACTPQLCKTHFNLMPKTALYNEYGPTEATVWCIAHQVTPEDVLGEIPLGRPVANAEIYLLNEQLKIVPSGAIGEIYIGGAGLAGQYHNRPQLTADAYLWVTLAEGKQQLLYKTGDLARYNSKGNIDFLGRIDQQVKIRGYRVEPSEIQRIIEAMPNVIEASVLVDTTGGSKRLIAFAVSKEPASEVEMQSTLRQKLPEHMVPSSLTLVKSFPKLPNGKIDQTALAKLKGNDRSAVDMGINRPANALEEKIIEIWKELLKLDSIGVEDNFFHLGGDSILSIQFIAKAKKAGIPITPNQIFDHQTVAKLAGFIAENESRSDQWDYLVTLRKEGTKRPLFCIHAGGGHVFFYNILTKYVHKSRPVYALQASGFYGDKPMHSSIVQMAKDYISSIRKIQPEGPYNIMSYCFSVSVGHEMVKQLKAQGQVCNLIVMDTANVPEPLLLRIKVLLKLLFKEPVKALKLRLGLRLLRLKLLLNKKVGTQEDRALSKVHENLIRINEEYQWSAHQEKIKLILTKKIDERTNAVILDSWQKMALGGVSVSVVDGDHANLFTEPDVAIVGRTIEACCL